jgi:DNA-binding transcriptional LysR family regulator
VPEVIDEGWNGLDLRHLAAFEAVASAGSFARAAASLGYTQPAVSQQVAALERIVGQRLFDRSSGRATATLTAAGTLLRGHVEAVVGQLVSARAELADLAVGESGTLRVGAFQTVAARLLPDLLRRYASRRPGVRIELHEALGTHEILTAVEAGEIDLAFALEPVDRLRFETRHVLDDEFVLVEPGSGAARTVESLAEVAALPLIVHRSCPSTDLLLEKLEALPATPTIVFRSDDNGAVKALVRAGVGVAVLPRMWMELGDNDGLDVSPLGHLLPPRRIVLAWRRGFEHTPVQRAFVDLACSRDPLRRAPAQRPLHA